MLPPMRLSDARTLSWKDGCSWHVDAETFARATARLARLEETIWGLEPILARWRALGDRHAAFEVDDFAPTEDDRAVFTAALARAVDDVRAVGPTELGFEDTVAYRAFLDRLAELHELFVTDITRRP